MSSAAITVGVVIATLEAAGFVLKKCRGSHKQYAHEDGRRTTVPGSRNKQELARGTLGSIQRQTGLRFGLYFAAGMYFGVQEFMQAGAAEGTQLAGLNRGPSLG